MDRKVISDAHAPNPIGPYNQAVISNGFVFTAGQIAIDPDTGQLVEGDFASRLEWRGERRFLKDSPLDF